METREQQLLAQGVKFLPWVGKDYERGIGYDNDGNLCYGGKKVLVLGESHYYKEAETEQDLIDGAKDPKWTKWAIDALLHHPSGHRWPSSFHKFEHAIVGKPLNEGARQEFWDHLAYYNYVQALVGGPRKTPKAKDFEESIDPFFAVLEELRPDYIIAWGMRLYRNMPGKNGRPGEVIVEKKYRSLVYYYRVNQIDYPCLFLRHPSASNFCIEPSHNALLRFMGA